MVISEKILAEDSRFNRDRAEVRSATHSAQIERHRASPISDNSVGVLVRVTSEEHLWISQLALRERERRTERAKPKTAGKLRIEHGASHSTG